MLDTTKLYSPAAHALVGWKRYVARLGLAAGSIVLAWSVGELVLRFQGADPPMLRFRQLDQALAGLPRHQFMQLIENDAELFWRLAPSVRLPENDSPFFGLISNAQSLREDHEIPLQKPKGQIRLLFLGDSCTFGYLVSHRHTFVAQAEALLREKYPSIDVKCINAGVPGYTLFQGWRFLETQGIAYAPDLVVLNFGWNDTGEWDGHSDREVYETTRGREPPRGLRWSRLTRRIWAAVRPSTSSSATDASRPRLRPDEFTALLAEIHATSQRIGADLLLVVGASRGNIVHGKVAHDRATVPLTPLQREQLRFGETLRLGPHAAPGFVDAIQIAVRLAMDRPIDDILFDDVHATPLMNRAIAEEIVRTIGPWLRHRTHG